MLTWDEEVKPSAPSPLASGLAARAMDLPPLNHAGTAGSATPTTHLHDGAPVPAPVAATPKPSAPAHRVVAADKRIINGQTDVNQLVPFKYKWA